MRFPDGTISSNSEAAIRQLICLDGSPKHDGSPTKMPDGGWFLWAFHACHARTSCGSHTFPEVSTSSPVPSAPDSGSAKAFAASGLEPCRA